MIKLAYLLAALVVAGLTALPIAVQAASTQVKEATPAPSVSSQESPTEPRSWQACASCHKHEGHNHAGACQSCHVGDVEPKSVEHPPFEPITDRTCIECHEKGSLP